MTLFVLLITDVVMTAHEKMQERRLNLRPKLMGDSRKVSRSGYNWSPASYPPTTRHSHVALLLGQKLPRVRTSVWSGGCNDRPPPPLQVRSFVLPLLAADDAAWLQRRTLPLTMFQVAVLRCRVQGRMQR